MPSPLPPEPPRSDPNPSDPARSDPAPSDPTPPEATPGVSRRRFLVGAGTLGAGGLLADGVLSGGLLAGGRAARGGGTGVVVGAPSVSLPGVHQAAGPTTRPGRGILVLVTLYGGNDGLNTVIPYTDSAYHAGRPTLGYQPDQVIPLTDGLSLNDRLTGLKSLWDAGRLAIVRGVGYPDPSLSHFQSMDIWQTASSDAEGPGWLGRWLDATGEDPMRAISVGATLPPALRGERAAATALTSARITLPGQPPFQNAYGMMTGAGPDRQALNGLVAATGADLLSVRQDLDRLGTPATSTSPATTSGSRPPGVGSGSGKGAPGAFATGLQTVASLIRGGAPTQVYQVSLSSFDTHSDEKTAHEQLLSELDHGVGTFFASLQGSSEAAGVVLMTYSEFGRRVAQNASGGTDHGTAAPLFIAGPGVRGGRFYGEQPSLTDLDGGDLKHTIDFRSVYATMLAKVIGVDPKAFLGAAYPTLDCI